MDNFADIYNIAVNKAAELGEQYTTRLKFEYKEINKQGAEQYWLDIYQSGKKFKTNKNGLVLPYLLEITTVDPIKNDIKPNIKRDPDYPDIDLDFVPEARDKVKEFATTKFGSENVCSVGLWQTYKPKSALKDVARSLGYHDRLMELDALSKELPMEFDNADDLEEALNNDAYEAFKKWMSNDGINKTIAENAFKLVGKIKTQGKHAGGLIISSKPLIDHLPMAKLGDHWTSEWTEGKSVQLSKFGFVKYDILGLMTLEYIWQAMKMVERNHGININWDEVPEDDAKALILANQLKTDSVFQLDTDVARGILAKGGVKTMMDLMVYTSLGRPGPMPMIDTYIARRDGNTDEWKSEEHPEVLERLMDTYGVCTFQEQVSQLLTDLADFTIPETEKARKIMSKKWSDQMVWVRDKILKGFTRNLHGYCPHQAPQGYDTSEINEVCGTSEWTWAKEYWKRLETFARYSFNRAHAYAYSLHIYKCLYLKAHYPVDWWCAVLNSCNIDRIPQYIGIARAEGVEFGTLDFNNLSAKFDIIDNKIIPGLMGIKNIGDKITSKLRFGKQSYKDVDDFIAQNFTSKTLFERLIKLGAFDSVHKNRKCIWYWYMCKYGKDKDARVIKNAILEKLGRKKLDITLKEFEEFFGSEDFSYEQKLEFQKAFLGYHWDSPMDIYVYNRSYTIRRAKVDNTLDCVVSNFTQRKTKKGKKFGMLMVTDGMDMAKVTVWSDKLSEYDPAEYFTPGVGLRIEVQYDANFGTFTIMKYGDVLKLSKRTSSEIITRNLDLGTEENVSED